MRLSDGHHLRDCHDVFPTAATRARGTVEATTERREGLVDDAILLAVLDGQTVVVNDRELALVDLGNDLCAAVLERLEVGGLKVRDACSARACGNALLCECR